MIDGVEYRKVGFYFLGPRITQLIYQLILPFKAFIKHDIWVESFTPPFSTAFLPIFTRKPVIKYSFFGSESDVRVAEFMCQFFLDTIETEIKLFKKSNTYKEESLTMPGKTLTTSFKHGICSRLGKRLVEMKDASKEKTNNEVGIVLFSKTAIVETKFKQLALRLKTSTSRTTTGSSSAFASGYVAGGKVSITTGKSVKSNQKQLS
jgi:hypothetical protein